MNYKVDHTVVCALLMDGWMDDIHISHTCIFLFIIFKFEVALGPMQESVFLQNLKKHQHWPLQFLLFACL